MNIEEAIEILKQEPDFSLNYYNRENAIDVLLTAYEKQQKEIEELKNADLTTVYISGVYDGEKKVEDKIKAEIEKLKDMKVDGEVFTTAVNFAIKVLQSFLEKE